MLFPCYYCRLVVAEGHALRGSDSLRWTGFVLPEGWIIVRPDPAFEPEVWRIVCPECIQHVKAWP